ncbi:MAG: hypothetical protein GYA24_22680 [Candidatus Lokiarchaeota archaeon]|nr:hypothetical protein [Candidatus Lokiarchaeota archaeon]
MVLMLVVVASGPAFASFSIAGVERPSGSGFSLPDWFDGGELFSLFIKAHLI